MVHMQRVTRVLLLLLLSVVGGMLAAMSFAGSIGPDGGIDAVSRPAVAPIALVFGGLAGVLLSPLMVWALWHRRLVIWVPSLYLGSSLLVVSLNLVGVRFAELIVFGAIALFLGVCGLCRKRRDAEP
jgi:hypothetical protein